MNLRACKNYNVNGVLRDGVQEGLSITRPYAPRACEMRAVRDCEHDNVARLDQYATRRRSEGTQAVGARD
jgi:hypothetical protein